MESLVIDVCFMLLIHLDSTNSAHYKCVYIVFRSDIELMHRPSWTVRVFSGGAEVREICETSFGGDRA